VCWMDSAFVFFFPQCSKSVTIVLRVFVCVRERVAIACDVIVCSLVSDTCFLCMLLSSHHITPLSFS